MAGGKPNIMYDNSHPVYPQLQQIGKSIIASNPTGFIVFSAHWQAQSEAIEVNTAEKNDLIYDFYGFPGHYYKEKFPNTGSRDLANEILGHLDEAKIPASGRARGLDHGIWACFKVAFDPESNPIRVPIVQVSLPVDSRQPVESLAKTHFALGKALAPLRPKGYQFVVSGIAVHNLRDFDGNSTGHSYAKTFDGALKSAMESSVDEREREMSKLLERSDTRKAHPTLEHLWPIYVGAGLAAREECKQIWTLVEGGLSWGMYKFGDV
ncbi:MAG: hypothetical protein M1814_006632 [Vezdaea aestivalis]|nr:MAG: hypothetical protein M1814_006632 [Vezdaea aestivalis]